MSVHSSDNPNCGCERCQPNMAAIIDEMRSTIDTLLDYIPSKCDENMHPAYCCNHSRKRCTGEADVAKAREVLVKAQAILEAK